MPNKTRTKQPKTQDLLFEIGIEELPTKAVKSLSIALAEQVGIELNKHNLSFKAIKSFGTPRRLAVIVSGLDINQQDYTSQKRGPALTACFEKNTQNFSKAAIGFASSCNTTPDKLEELITAQGSWLVHNYKIKGKATKDLLNTIINSAMKNLPIAKPMRWNNNSYNFVRPIHWLVLLFGNKTIPLAISNQDVKLDNIKSSNKTYGHRFLAPKAISLKSPAEYETKLKKSFVIASFEQRKNNINTQINKIACANKLTPLINNNLLEEVTSLVEWPVALMGKFDPKFLTVPQECLITTMVTNQKYFATTDAKNKLQPFFIFVSNIKSKKPKQIISGNEKVLAARLSDAAFFYNNDKKSNLESRVEPLDKITYQQKLGSLLDKTNRTIKLSNTIATNVNNIIINLDILNAAAKLAKADLCSEMVREFPELQGIMGKYYTLHDNQYNKLTPNIAEAIEQHYLPKHSGDNLPESIEACIVAIADKLDSITGIFSIGQKPTGDKDPFGLRRAALGILRILIEKAIPIDLKFLINKAVDNQQITQNLNVEQKNQIVSDCLLFCFDRLKNYYADQNIMINLFYAVNNSNTTSPYDFHQRITAVNNFIKLPEAEQLIAANKRVKNILNKQDITNLPTKINESYLQEPAEITLNKLLNSKTTTLATLLINNNYNNILADLASLQAPIDLFFDKVMVNSEDVNLKNNRLLLLKNIQTLFNKVADISELQ